MLYLPKLAVPTNIRSTVIAGEATLSWTASPSATVYLVDMEDHQTGAKEQYSVSVETDFTAKGLAPGYYTFKVSAAAPNYRSSVGAAITVHIPVPQG